MIPPEEVPAAQWSRHGLPALTLVCLVGGVMLWAALAVLHVTVPGFPAIGFWPALVEFTLGALLVRLVGTLW